MAGPLTHLQLIPADTITALYDSDSETLYLNAAGEHVDITRDIGFERLPFAGGLLFDLKGWVGPIILGESPYSATSSFNIKLPNAVTPSNTVVVNTENKKGWVVPIQPLLKEGPQEGPQETQAAVETKEAPSDIPEVKAVAGNPEIVTGLGQHFTIKQADSIKSQGAGINISFDKNYVVLDDASITDGKIEWKFTSHQVGATEVVVTIGQSDPIWIQSIIYQVSIAPPNSDTKIKPLASFSVAPANGSSNGSKVPTPKNSIHLSWDGFVNSGYNLIKNQYPEAKLYVIEAKSATGKPVETEWGLVKNRIIAKIDDKKTAVITSIGWGSFGPVEVIQAPFVGNDVLDWPLSLEIHEAFAILRKGGYEKPVSEVTLRSPLIPGPVNQAYYFFKIGNEVIAIGALDKQIQNASPTGQEIRQS
ncbi:hypothetical protein BKA56DRAFT_625893 [Ilyonectria sp. MPI-CAGE-AT-0026]|nr:hypothetical protein BKA56DRAFT_625893 [Ilyonectria sp. MPI-CAGE-AT-0026]